MAENPDADHQEFNYQNFEWGYGTNNGPDKWCHLQECRAIRAPVWGQSPINVVTAACENDFFHYEADAQYDFRPGTVKRLRNTGRTWQIDYAEPDLQDMFDWSYCDGTLRSTYSLSSIHMHWGEEDEHGSEHYIDGQDCSAEVHFVYFNQDHYESYEEACKSEGGLMIQAMQFELGEADPGLNQIIQLLPQISYKEQSLDLSRFDPFDLMPKKTKEDMYSVYHYYGSMCQPPCMESVTWILFKKRKTISREQLEEFRSLRTHKKDTEPQEGESEFILDNRRVKSADKLFPLNVEKARIEYDEDEYEAEHLQQNFWEGKNHREVISSEAEKPWIGSEEMYNGCYKDDQTVTTRVKDLLKPVRVDCSHFNCQFKGI